MHNLCATRIDQGSEYLELDSPEKNRILIKPRSLSEISIVLLKFPSKWVLILFFKKGA